MFWQGKLFGQEYAVWDNQPGGTVVDRYTDDGVRYVVVEFENSPGRRYVYRAK
jgi:hypothetical protein